MTYTMRSYFDIRSFFGNVLPVKMGKVLAMSMQPHPDYFTDNYQSKSASKFSDIVTLVDLINAVHKSERLFQQYPVNKREVKSIATSIFVNDRWLMRSPSLGEVVGDDGYYIIGGRHRAYAVAAGIAQMCNAVCKDELDAEELYEMMLSTCNINVETVVVPDSDSLVTLIKADNDSRTMRGSELAHIKTQMLGLSATETDNIAKEVVYNENFKPKEVSQMLAQMFVRRKHKHLKPQTLQILGEKVAQWVVYGATPGERIKQNAPTVNTPSRVESLMKQAYDAMLEVTEGMEIVARNANDVVTKVIERIGAHDVTNTNGIMPIGWDKKPEEPVGVFTTVAVMDKDELLEELGEVIPTVKKSEPRAIAWLLDQLKQKKPVVGLTTAEQRLIAQANDPDVF